MSSFFLSTNVMLHWEGNLGHTHVFHQPPTNHIHHKHADCRVHHPGINRAVDVISEATTAMKTRAYDPEQGDGGLRYIQVSVL